MARKEEEINKALYSLDADNKRQQLVNLLANSDFVDWLSDKLLDFGLYDAFLVEERRRCAVELFDEVVKDDKIDESVRVGFINAVSRKHGHIVQEETHKKEYDDDRPWENE